MGLSHAILPDWFLSIAMSCLMIGAIVAGILYIDDRASRRERPRSGLRPPADPFRF